MKSVGEVMAIGRTFKQALAKGMRSLETGKADGAVKFDDELIEPRLITPNPERLGYIRYAFERGYSEARVHEFTSVDPWFLRQVREMVDQERDLANSSLMATTRAQFIRPGLGTLRRSTFAAAARSLASPPSSIASTPAPLSLKASRRTFTQVTNRNAKRGRVRATKS
jgi:hypothetical protein